MEIKTKQHTITLPYEEYKVLIEAFEAPKKELKDKIDHFQRFTEALGKCGVTNEQLISASRLMNENK